MTARNRRDGDAEGRGTRSKVVPPNGTCADTERRSTREGPAHCRLALLLPLVLGLGARLFHLADIADSPFFTRPMIDGQAYDIWALAIRSGTEVAKPFYQDPLYPHFLALVYQLLGRCFAAVYVLQVLLGSIVILLVSDTARQLFDWRAGLAAGLITALYRPFVFFEGQVEKTALAVFLTALFLWSLARGLKSKNLLWPLASGASLGLAVLTRANLLAFAPLLPLVYLFRSRTWLGAALAGAGIVLVIAPLSVRNSILAREFVLTTTQAGQNFFIGNSGHNHTGQYEAPPWVRPNPQFEEADFAQHAREQSGRELSYSGISRYYWNAALNWMRASPRPALRLLVRKSILYFNGFEVPDNQDIGFFSRFSWILRLPLFGFGIVFAFGLAGMVVHCRRGERALGTALPRVALIVFFFGSAASVIAFFVLDRYRLPNLPALLPFAGAMPVWLVDEWRSKRFRGFASGLALVAGCFLITTYPVRRGSTSGEQAQCLVNLASSYFHEGDTAKAVAAYREALVLRPGHAEAHRNLGMLLLERGDTAQAFEHLNRATRAEPANPVTRYHLGRLFESRAELEAALEEYRASARLKPGEPKYRFALATVLQKLQRYDAALAQYDTLLLAEADNPLVHHNLAVALYNLGRFDDANRELAAVRRLGGPVNPGLERLLEEKLRERAR